MYQQTTHHLNTPYFTSIGLEHKIDKPTHRLLTITKSQSDSLLKFTKPVILTEHKGLALLVTTTHPQDKNSYKYFLLQNSIQIHSDIYFNTLSLTPECQLYLEPTLNEDPRIIRIQEPIRINLDRPALNILDIYGIHYQTYSPYEQIINHPHYYYELVIVDQGQAQIEKGQRDTFTLDRNMAFFNLPHQKNKLSFFPNQFTTLISILFQAEGLPHSIMNQAIRLDHRNLQLIQRMMQISQMPENKDPFYFDELQASLKILLSRICQGEMTATNEFSTSMRENYENELFQSIVNFLDDQVDCHHQVNDLVEKFNISRSSLQSLFRKYTNQTPKQYINSLRLKKSKLLIRESKLTLSEIATELGYGSIQYFSRAFSNEFGMSPSAYAKSMIK